MADIVVIITMTRLLLVGTENNYKHHKQTSCIIDTSMHVHDVCCCM